jgi:translation initiation factor 3 subunit B
LGKLTSGQSISIYEAPGMHLLDKKSVKIDGVRDFEWRPREDVGQDEEDQKTGKEKEKEKGEENMLAYWTPEVQNQPARVTVMGVPSKKVMRSKNLFNVAEVRSDRFRCLKGQED